MQTTPLDPAAVAAVIDNFHRDGFAVVRQVLGADECAFLRRRTDEIVDDPGLRDQHRHGSYHFVLSNPLEEERAFAELFVREPIVSLVRTLLGPECRFCGQNVIRNVPARPFPSGMSTTSTSWITRCRRRYPAGRPAHACRCSG
jgi:hypothetical protein